MGQVAVLTHAQAFDASESTRSQYGYLSLEFVYILVASWILWLAKSKDAKGMWVLACSAGV